MTPDQLTALAANGESDTLEFKRSTGERREAMHALCAMLNHRGGRVLFGVAPDGSVVGQQVSDRTLEELAQEIQSIEPPVFPDVVRMPLPSGAELVVLTVAQGGGRPYSYKGTAYRRVGNVNAKLSRDEYNRMLLERLHADQRWETEPATGWTVADLDTAEVARTVEESIRRGRLDDPGTRDPAELLRGLGLLRNGQLLRAAVALFGKAEELELRSPQCMLRVARFRGLDRTEFLDNKQFHGNVFQLLSRAERYLRESLPVAGRVLPGLFERVDDPLYPPVALREALANAFSHRDYSIGGGSVAVAIYDNRLEITSSGSLHFGLTPEALFKPHESLPWNPLIARVLYRRGVVESWGRGTLKMAELLEQAGLPRQDMEDAGGCVTVRFWPLRYVPPQRVAHDLTERQRIVLATVERHPGGLGLRHLRDELRGVATEWEIKGDLALLKSLHLVEHVGWGASSRWRLVVRQDS